MQTSLQIRNLFKDFFIKNNHEAIRSSSLVPANDPTLMFTNSGMVQFKDIFTGKESKPYKNATSAQKCIRAGGKHNDLDNVGYTKRHLTFFEMLGNFSFGGYFKEEAIKYAWDLITQDFGLDKKRIFITTYHQDTEAFNIWKKVSGFSDDKIIKISTKDNFWMMGDVGPCGPCSEIFYDQGEQMFGGLPGTEAQDGDRYIEIWNLVFMQFEQLASGEMKNLPKKCVDTGMGLERIAGVVQGVYDNFKTDQMRTLIKCVEDITGVRAMDDVAAHRVVADHLRSSAFLIADGVIASNEGRGYVLRRIIRRAVRYVSNLGYKELLLHELVPTLVIEMGESYPELIQNQSLITDTLKLEESSFRVTLDRGMHLLNSEVEKLSSGSTLSGDIAFKLHDTYGFPIDLTQNILREKDITVDTKSFESLMAEQKLRARKAWSGSGENKVSDVWFNIKERTNNTEFLGYTQNHARGVVNALVQNNAELNEINNKNEFYLLTNQTPFYAESGGQMGDVGLIKLEDGTQIKVLDTIKPVQGLHAHRCVLINGKVKLGDVVDMKIDLPYRDGLRRNHTATHLLHAILREKFGSQVTQKGSLVAHDRLRFDFTCSKTITRELLDEIEMDINSLVLQDAAINTKVMKLDEAINNGAIALFGEKYSDDVRVVSVEAENNSHSVELCGGTHVARLGEIGLFKILYEASISAGIRRIEAVTGKESLEIFQKNSNIIRELSSLLQGKEHDLLERVDQLINANKKLQKDLAKASQSSLADALKKAEHTTMGDVNFSSCLVNEGDVAALRNLVQQKVSQSEREVILLGAASGDKLLLICGVSKNLHGVIKANDLINLVVRELNGKGGGSPLLAQGTVDNTGLSFKSVVSTIQSFLKNT